MDLYEISQVLKNISANISRNMFMDLYEISQVLKNISANIVNISKVDRDPNSEKVAILFAMDNTLKLLKEKAEFFFQNFLELEHITKDSKKLKKISDINMGISDIFSNMQKELSEIVKQIESL